MHANKNDFVELRFTGYSEGQIFDSNIEEDVKKLNPNVKAKETIVVVGRGMVVSGLDKALEGKEIGKEFRIELKAKDAFGERKRNLVRLIPLKAFQEQKVQPQPGMVLALDDVVVKIVTVSGARVIADFNNPLAGKDVEYKAKIVRKVENENEKVKTLFGMLLKFVPEFEIKDKIIIKGPKVMETAVKAFNPTFKELIGKELGFELFEKAAKS